MYSERHYLSLLRYLEDELYRETDFDEIVGESPALKRVLEQAKHVASSDAAVLIQGEPGTGKETMARAIHRMSLRNQSVFIKLNCTEVHTGLLESELFGHPKGTFAGAITQKIGRLELAHRGTLFLDEVGKLPLELQSRVVRVLQEQEFRRAGSTRAIEANIRLIAATTRDLAKTGDEHQFRSDLYLRLHQCVIRVPPLRKRTSDIPLLVRYFMQKFSRRMNKKVEIIPDKTMPALMNWNWPGNVRELKNFIERSVILSHGPVLRAPLAELDARSNGPSRQGDTQKHTQA